MPELKEIKTLMGDVLSLLSGYYEKKDHKNQVPFNIELFKTTLGNLLNKGTNGNRYSQRIISFAKYLKFVGGKGLIKVLRGISNSNSNSQDPWNSILGIPSIFFLFYFFIFKLLINLNVDY